MYACISHIMRKRMPVWCERDHESILQMSPIQLKIFYKIREHELRMRIGCTTQINLNNYVTKVSNKHMGRNNRAVSKQRRRNE